MKNNVSVLLLFFLSFVLSCRKDLGPGIPTLYVPESLKQMLPYKNGQIIRYISTSGHLIEASISMETKIWEKSNCIGCTPYEREETIGYEFLVGTNPFVRLSIDTRPIIFMSIFSPVDNYQIGGGFDFNTVPGVPQPACSGPRQYCLPSVTLNGNTYTNVLVATNGTTAAKDITKAYYIISKGLIGFEYGNGYTYSLKE